MADNYDAILRRLAEETDALPRQELPGFMSWAANHPSVMNYRTKNPERYDQDKRRAHFLNRVREEIPGSSSGSLAERYPAINAAIGQESIDASASPYESYGEDHPAWNAAVWMQSLPSAVYATGQMLANKVDPEANPYPDAPRQFAKSMNTFTGILPGMSTEDLGLLPKNLSRWRDLQDMRDEMTPSWKVMDPRYGDAMTKAKYRQDLLSGEEFLEGAGVSKNYSPVLGAALDVGIDPFTGYGSAAKLSRAGRGAEAMKVLGVDAGFGIAPLAIPAAIGGVYDSATEIRRLLGVDY
jgi:hypothetical protein